MTTEIVLTHDGSHTIFSPIFNQWYHSIHGAVQESLHVFLWAGFEEITKQRKQINLLEVGFGTGLNALITWQAAEKIMINVNYVGIEAFPLPLEQTQQLNYHQDLQKIHNLAWEHSYALSPFFSLKKHEIAIQDFDTTEGFDLVYFDAFAPSSQPELWSVTIFKKLYDLMNSGGILTTYCSKSIVRRTMQSAGFVVEKPVGPFGKREMVRALKV